MHLRPKDNDFIISGSIWKGILTYCIPIMIGSLFQQLYNMVDTIVVGNFVGTDALAAVGGSAGEVAGVTMWFFGGIASGATVTVAQHYGARNLQGVHRDIHNGYALALIGGALLTAVGIVFSRPLMTVMRTDESLMRDSLIYLRILFSGLIPSIIFNIGSGILRALGDSVRPLYYLITCCIVNIAGDLLLVLVFPLGVTGVAVATISAQTISAVLVTRRIMKLDDVYRLRIRKIRVYGEVMRVQLKIGIPGGFQSALFGIANMTIQSFINTLGKTTVAAFGAYRKIDALFWMVSGALGTSVTTFVGQNYGAGSISRVKESTRVTLIMHAIASAAVSALIVLLRRPLFRIFTDDPAVIEVGVKIVLGMSSFYLTYTLMEVLASSLRGLGIVGVPTALTLGGICVLRIVFIMIFMPIYHSVNVVIIVYPLSWAVTSLLFVIYYLARRKKFLRISSEADT